MSSPLFQRAGLKPAVAAPVAAPVPMQFQAAPMVNPFDGIAKARARSSSAGLGYAAPGEYLVRIDTMRMGITDIKKGAVYNYIWIEQTNLLTLQDKEGGSLVNGTAFQHGYNNKMYPEAFQADIKSFLMACFNITPEQSEALKPDGTPVYSDDDWKAVISEACGPEQVLKGRLLRVRYYMNRKGTFTKATWVERVSYSDLRAAFASDPTLNASRVRWCSDEEIDRQIAKEVAEAAAAKG